MQERKQEASLKSTPNRWKAMEERRRRARWKRGSIAALVCIVVAGAAAMINLTIHSSSMQRKAQEGVKVFVIVYRNIESAIPIDSEYTKWSLLDLHENVCVQ